MTLAPNTHDARSDLQSECLVMLHSDYKSERAGKTFDKVVKVNCEKLMKINLLFTTLCPQGQHVIKRLSHNEVAFFLYYAAN
jgi:hypothetical protein